MRKLIESHMRGEFNILGTRLKELQKAHKTVYYIPARGGANEPVIRRGTLNFFKDFRINAIEIPTANGVHSSIKDVIPANSMLIIGGGEGWSRSNRSEIITMDMAWEAFDHVIVLPSSYHHVLVTPNAEYWSRDLAAGNLIPTTRSRSCYCLSFYYPEKWVLDNSRSFRLTPVEFLFRRDGDSLLQKIPDANWDHFYTKHHVNHLAPSADFFSNLSQTKVIHTDYSVVAAVAFMQGREVHLYPNKSGTNKGFFAACLEGKGATYWHDEYPDPGFDYGKGDWRPKKKVVKKVKKRAGKK